LCYIGVETTLDFGYTIVQVLNEFIGVVFVRHIVVMKLYRSGLDLRHGPPAYESDMLPAILSYSENGKYCISMFGILSCSNFSDLCLFFAVLLNIIMCILYLNMFHFRGTFLQHYWTDSM